MEEKAVSTEQVAEEVQEQEVNQESNQEPNQENTETIAEQPTETTEPEIVIPPPKKQTAQERINELTRKRREAEREAERLRELLEKKEKAPERMITERPRLEEFATTEQYEDALLEWNTQRTLKKYRNSKTSYSNSARRKPPSEIFRRKRKNSEKFMRTSMKSLNSLYSVPSCVIPC